MQRPAKPRQRRRERVAGVAIEDLNDRAQRRRPRAAR